MTMEVNRFYLNTSMERKEHTRLNINLIPSEIQELYNLKEIVKDNGWIYVEIRKGMYGPPKVGTFANNLLKERLAKHIYPRDDSHQEFGDMCGAWSPSALWSMTLESSPPAKKMQSTYCIASKKTTRRSKRTGKTHCTMALPTLWYGGGVGTLGG